MSDTVESDNSVEQQLQLEDVYEAIRVRKEEVNRLAISNGDPVVFDVAEIEKERYDSKIKRERLEHELADLQKGAKDGIDVVDIYRVATLPNHIRLALEAPERLAHLPAQVQETLASHPELAEEVLNHINLEAQYGASAAKLISSHPELQAVIAPETTMVATAAEPAVAVLAL